MAGRAAVTLDPRALRRRIVEAAYQSGEPAHIPSALSVVDILAALYGGVMGPDDVFVLSKGHAALALYAVLEAGGVIPAGTMHTLPGHPCHLTPGVSFGAGSLGHGLGAAAGLALGKRLAGQAGRVYVLVGDQELDEGSCWEAIAQAVRLEIDALTIIVDANGSGANALSAVQIADRFAYFGCQIGMMDGHGLGIGQIIALPSYGQPCAIVARTVKGHGVARMEADPAAWHRRKMTETEYHEICRELA